MSVFILQMFLASSNLNHRARNTDVAIAEAITEIENFKKHTSLSGYLSSNDIHNVSENGDIISIRFFYDKDWNRVEAEMPTGACYYMHIDITADDGFAPTPQKEGVSYGKLYTVEVDVADISTSENSLLLVSFQSKKYFSPVF